MEGITSSLPFLYASLRCRLRRRHEHAHPKQTNWQRILHGNSRIWTLTIAQTLQHVRKGQAGAHCRTWDKHRKNERQQSQSLQEKSNKDWHSQNLVRRQFLPPWKHYSKWRRSGYILNEQSKSGIWTTAIGVGKLPNLHSYKVQNILP